MLLEKIKTQMLKDLTVKEFLELATAPYKTVTAEDAVRYNDLYTQISQKYNLRYSEMREVLGLCPNFGPYEGPQRGGSIDDLFSVLSRVKVIWDREGFGSDPAESDKLYADLKKVLVKFTIL